VHAAVLLLAIGVAGSAAYQTVREVTLRPGQSLKVDGYVLTDRGMTTTQGPNYHGFRAQLDVTRGASHVTTLTPGENIYAIEGPANEASIYHDPRNLGDLFTTAQIQKGNAIDLKVLVKPLVNLIWLAGFVFVAGSLIALWPDAAEERRLAERYAHAPVAAEA
jgi:cytochrome c-type biogenesis protein CcmF